MALAAALAAVAAPAGALKSDRDQPIQINARSIELNEKTGLAVYRGDVTVQQGTLHLSAERVEVQTRARRTELIRAFGAPVRMRQRMEGREEEVHVSGRRLEYRVATRTIELFEDVTLRQGGDVFRAERIRYDLDSEVFRAEAGTDPGARVSAVYHPPPSEAPPTTPP